MQEEVDVGVNQAGEKCGVAEIDEFGAVRVIHFGADFYDQVALDEDFAGSNRASGFHVEQARGVKDNGARRWRGRGLRLLCLRANRWSERQRAAEKQYCKCGESASTDHVFRAR